MKAIRPVLAGLCTSIVGLGLYCTPVTGFSCCSSILSFAPNGESQTTLLFSTEKDSVKFSLTLP